ncbi:gliding motility-associated C-terminal domain-containing protein [Sphingobacterium sp. xlx-130]|uniref:gliding motility-associated C-terminal domain-containing protein n=1 Tax=Sphingobacterium sp. xlx-130 TaxID=2654323 RepID=UPI0013DAE238|nr:gliding motility-associated C-terminal domain-containing protein [Sphingobacterium sp. xlx-130]
MKLMTIFSKDAERLGQSRSSGLNPFVLCMLTLFLGLGQLSAQVTGPPIKVDLDIPALSVCGDYETVKLQVLSTTVKQTGATLKIALPAGFQLALPADQTKTVQATFNSMATGTAVPGALTGLTATGPPQAREVTVTLPELEATPAGQANPDFLEIEFKVQALCEAINTSGNVASVAYTLINNTGNFPAESEALNVIFGVLHVSVVSSTLSGVKGDVITRTITIRNDGNGTVNTFKLERTLGAGLSVVSTDANAENSVWIEETAGSGVYVYRGAAIPNGQKVTFTEKVRIEDCDISLITKYKAYYGCEGECEVGTGLGESTIILDTSIKPSINVIDTDPTVKLTCLDGNEFVKLYEIKNTGSGTAKDIKFIIGTENQERAGYGSTYFERFEFSTTKDGTFTPLTTTSLQTWSADRSAVYGTAGKDTRVEATIDQMLAPGESVFVRVVQKNNPPVAQGNCTDLESSVRFGNTYFEGSYRHDKACSETDIINFGKTNFTPSNTFSFDGINMGGQEVFPGVSYQTDFVLRDLSVAHHGLAPGAHLDLVVELSPNLTVVSPDGVRLFDEKGKVVGTAFSSDGNTYVFRFLPDLDGKTINLSSYRLLFDANINCGAAQETYYRIKPVLYPEGDGGCNIALKCYEQKLTNKCDPGDCENGGLVNGPVSLKRVNYGLKEQDPDAANNTGAPFLPLTQVNPDDFPLLRRTAFTTNDILEVSQTNKVKLIGNSPAWTTGKMVVKLTEGENLDFTPVANSGKIVITRGGNTATITGLSSLTKDTGLGVAVFDFNATTFNLANVSGDLGEFSGFIDADIVTLSFQVQPKRNGNNGLREFSVESGFTQDGTSYSCGGASHASGYYAKGTLNYSGGGTGNISSCDNNSPVGATLEYTLLNNHRNALFPFEFRQFVSPKTAVFNVSAGLEMTGVKLVLRNQSEAAQTKDIVLGMPQGGTVNFDLNEGLKQLQGGAYTQGYLNEGFVLDIYPIVKTLCEAGAQETVEVMVTLNGTVEHASVNYYDEDIKTVSQTLTYNTGADALRVTAPASPQSVTNKIQWIVQVQNRSSFRDLKNVWLSKTAGPIEITSIQKLTSSSDWNAVGQPVAESNGFYQLGDLNHGASSYYLVTAPIPTTTCESSTLKFVYGESCEGYPTDKNSACTRGSATLDLVYTPRSANVQSRVIEQISSSVRPLLCEQFTYTIELNNAGDGAAKDIKVTVPFVNGDPLTYKATSFAVTAAFQGSTVPGYTTIDDVQVNITPTPNGIVFTIPETALLATDKTLPAAYKMNVKFTLLANGCEFRSGQRIAFNIDANNICGSTAKHSNSTSNRVTVKGAERIDAELKVNQSDAAIVATTAPGNVIRAKYSFDFSNIDKDVVLVGTDGQDIGNGLYPHKFSIKLPANWAFERDLNDLFAATVATFDSTDSEKGHVFVLKANVPKGRKISLVDAGIKFTGNIADFKCDEIKQIKESVFGKFKPEGCPTFNCEMEQVLLEHVTSMSLAAPVVAAENQVFCVTDKAKLKDLVVTGDNLRFYDQAEDGNQLDANTLLGPVAGSNPSANNLYTYYVSASVLATACETPRIPVTVYIPVANAGADQSRVNGKEFTLNGNFYQAPAKGNWTVVTISGADITDIVIQDPTSRNTKVTMPIGAEVILEWTLAYGTCTTSDKVFIRSLINPIVADDNNYTVTNSKTGTGSTPLETVLKNDKLGNNEATNGNVTVTPGVPNHSGLTMNPNGQIAVAPGTPAGKYQYPYQICEIVNPKNCDDAVAYITIVPPVIDAIDDDYTATPINGMTGGKTSSVLNNDKLNNVAVIPSEVILTPGTSSNPGITMNSDGTITVAPGTPADTYTHTYRICEVLNPTNCDNATATVRVTAASIVANPDAFGPVTSTSGSPNVGNALTNDKLNGLPATLDKVTVAVVTPATPVNGAPVPVLDPNTGIVSVPKGTPAKDYTITYRICEVLNPANCANADITVSVTAPLIQANHDTYGPVRGDQGNSNLGNVLLNDVIDGHSVIKENVILTVTQGAQPVNPGAKVPVIDANGQVAVPAGTPDGIYTIEYSICDKINPTNCSPATVTVTVADATIDAIDDIYAPINGKVGGQTSSVLGNDLINGTAVTLGTDITLTPGTSPLPGKLTMNPNGTITVSAGTPAGTYQYPYTICSVLNPTDCDQAIATVIVTAAPIDAVDDNYSHTPVNGKVGTTTPLSSVLGNDLLNNVGVVNSDITLTPGTSPLPGKITMNPNNGTIEVSAGTPAGTYIYTYRICEVLNPTNCDNAIATIVVAASAIQAVEDNYGSINGKTGTTTALPSVLENDLLNGVKVVPSEVKLTPGTRPHPGIVMAADGTVTVAPGTPAGDYVYPYTICELLNPTNCDQTVANIKVVASTIEAVDNDFTNTPINGMTGGKTSSVLNNDILNNEAIVPSEVILAPGTPSHSGLTMNSDGTITVAPGTPADTYTHAYRICEVLNPTNCDDAVATVRVLEAVIKANDENFKASNGASGSQNVGNALTNDRLNGLPTALDKVTIDIVSPATPMGNAPIPVLDPNTGIVSVPEGTPAGAYKIVYRICEILNPTNCSQATITVTVDKATIIARPETYGPVATVDGHPNLGNVLHNDELNREQASLDKVSLTVTATAKGAKPVNPNLIVPVLDPATGIVSVPVGTPADTYQIKYRICELLNPTNCAETEVTVIVTPSQINAVNDVYESVLGLHANTVGNALDNDSFNNKGGLSAFKDGKIKFTNVTPAASQPGAPAAYAANVPVLNTATGEVTTPAMTPAGKYVIGYEICEVADPTNCDQTSITVIVTAAEIVAKEDFAVNISSVSGKANAVNVIDNDKLNNVYTNINQVSILVKTAAESLPNAVNTNVPVLNTATGQISIPAKTPAGEYKIFYEICELLNPTNCDRATAYIQVALPKVDAVNDAFEPVNSSIGNATLGNVLINDRYNESVTAVTLNEVSLKVVQPARSVPNATNNLVPFIEASGNINVPATTPEGTYQIQYEICDLINPTNCDKAIATVKVFASLVEAIDDHFGTTIGMDGSTSVGNILTNDRFNSQTAGSATTDNVRVEVMVPGVPNHNAVNTNVPVLDPATGNVSVPKGTPAGSYQIVYRICDLINLTHCDQAVVNIDVRVALIDAVDDQFTPINGYDGGKTASVLYSNDKLNNKSITAANQSDVIFTPDVDGPYPGKLTMNADGTVTVAPQTKAGVYRWWYTICEALNPENCDRAVATITVLAAPIDAVEDQFTTQIDRSGAVTSSVLDNDLLNGLAVVDSEIKLTPGTPSHPGLTMNPDGSIHVQPGMKVGAYTYPYTICELLNPTNCDQAVATVVITAEDIFIPNAITPNGDGKNDFFEIRGWEAYERIELVVFNRWGNEVFRNNTYDNRWNGSGLSDGTYYYILKLINGSTVEQRQGWVLINGGR